MSKLPPIPPEQRSFPGENSADRAPEGRQDRRDAHTGLQSSQPGDADSNLQTQGRQANRSQNTSNRRQQGPRT
jgi:hypothetical protein